MGQFHQNSMSSLYTQSSQMHKRQSSHQCGFVLLGPMRVIAAHKMLMKLKPGLNFTNMFMRSFYAPRSPKCRKKWWFECIFFALLGSVHVKALSKMLMKLTPGCHDFEWGVKMWIFPTTLLLLALRSSGLNVAKIPNFSQISIRVGN